MKRQTLRQVVPALIMAGAAVVPIATTAEILMQGMSGAGAIASGPSAPIAMAPARTPSRVAGASSATSSSSTRTYQGPVVRDPFGGVQATVTITKKMIADVAISAPQDTATSSAINQQAVPLLRRETLQAQSAHINAVSGATYTSQSYAQSLQGALDQARNGGNAVVGSVASSPAAGNGASGIAQSPSVSVPAND